MKLACFIVALALVGVALSAQSTNTPPLVAPFQSGTDGERSAKQTASDTPRSTGSTESKLYPLLRKYGPWDYKQQSSEYRRFTNFNFGAVGHAAGLSEETLLSLASMSNPSREDILALDDPEMLRRFPGNSELLEKLRAMTEKDARVTRIAKDFTAPNSHSKSPLANTILSPARWDEYRSLFEKLDLSEGIVRTEDYPGAVFFIVRSKGLCTGGTSAGYVYSATALSPIADSPGKALVEMERKHSRNEGTYYVFKQLRTNWYAFYEADW